MNFTAVTTSPPRANEVQTSRELGAETVAATLVQQPGYVDVADSRWDDNARFIAHARTDVPRLLAEIKRLRALLAESDDETA